MAPEPCPTAADAKLRTAVFTLHGINSHLSMTMAFPPALRCVRLLQRCACYRSRKHVLVFISLQSIFFASSSSSLFFYLGSNFSLLPKPHPQML
jgi:hypothetical protein